MKINRMNGAESDEGEPWEALINSQSQISFLDFYALLRHNSAKNKRKAL